MNNNQSKIQKKQLGTEEQPEEPTEVFGLTELKIQGIELEPQFQTDIYEYKIKLTEDIEKLDITSLTTETNSKIEITGNENLVEGENIITIMVKSENEEKTATYQILVNKIVEKQEDIINVETDHQQMIKKIIIISAAVGIILIIIVATIIVKIRKNRDFNDDYIPYEDLNADYEEKETERQIENEEEFYEEDISNKKSQKGKRFK